MKGHRAGEKLYHRQRVASSETKKPKIYDAFFGDRFVAVCDGSADSRIWADGAIWDKCEVYANCAGYGDGALPRSSVRHSEGG